MMVDCQSPTANNIDVIGTTFDAPVNLNLLSKINPKLQFNYWDGIGDGMTTLNEGDEFTARIITKGPSCLKYFGALILPAGGRIGFQVDPEEDGNFSMDVVGFFQGGNG